MEKEERVRELIYQVVDEINGQLVPDQRVEKVPEAALYGEEGALNSLGLVQLIAGVEERVEEEFGMAVNLADEQLLAAADDPFRTIAALAAYIVSLL